VLMLRAARKVTGALARLRANRHSAAQKRAH